MLSFCLEFALLVFSLLPFLPNNSVPLLSLAYGKGYYVCVASVIENSHKNLLAVELHHQGYIKACSS